jgi:hypothetical protein
VDGHAGLRAEGTNEERAVQNENAAPARLHSTRGKQQADHSATAAWAMRVQSGKSKSETQRAWHHAHDDKHIIEPKRNQSEAQCTMDSDAAEDNGSKETHSVVVKPADGRLGIRCIQPLDQLRLELDAQN